MAKGKISQKSQKIPLQISRTSNGVSSSTKYDPTLVRRILEDTLESYSRANQLQLSAHDLIGSLPDWAIKELIQDGTIKIDPLREDWESLVDEVTIDFHLGPVLKVFRQEGLDTIDTRHSTREDMESMMQTVILKPGQPFILTENDFVIAATRERLTLPNNIIGLLNGKSSLARLGVVVHSTAARFDPGWDGCPVLEFGTFLKGKKIVIYEGSPICAFSFEKMAAGVERTYMQRSTSKYGGSTLPIVADEPGKRKGTI